VVTVDSVELRRPVLARDDPSTDTVVDVLTEEELLHRMGNLTPMDAHTRGGGGVEGQGS